jgi:hypothetical protein
MRKECHSARGTDWLLRSVTNHVLRQPGTGSEGLRKWEAASALTIPAGEPKTGGYAGVGIEPPALAGRVGLGFGVHSAWMVESLF